MLETGLEDRQRCATDVQCYPGKQWANDPIRGDSEQVSGHLLSVWHALLGVVVLGVVGAYYFPRIDVRDIGRSHVVVES